MKTKDFLAQLKPEQIVEAIRSAEKVTSGQIRVFISHKPGADPIAAARREFVRLNMSDTKEANGVLLYVAPLSHKFAIIGDTGIHKKCGDEFWRLVAGEISSRFKAGDFTAGIILGIQKAGSILAKHFPKKSGGSNELPDDIAHD